MRPDGARIGIVYDRPDVRSAFDFELLGPG